MTDVGASPGRPKMLFANRHGMEASRGTALASPFPNWHHDWTSTGLSPLCADCVARYAREVTFGRSMR